MIIHRPHRGGLYEAMAESREFETIEDCINTLVSEFNESHGNIFTVSTDDILVYDYGSDMRVGWKNQFMLCIKPYCEVKDKPGYERYFIKAYDTPFQFLGFISTDYDKKYLKRGVAE